MGRKLPNLKMVLAVVILLVSALSHVTLASNITIDFNGISGADGSPFTSYMEFGFTVTAALTNGWLVGQSFGNPPPYIYFVAQPNQFLTETIAVTDGGAKFSFSQIDLYSSITTIPYTFTGFLGQNQVFTTSGIVPNTFGNFATVMNPFSTVQIDTLDVTLTDAAPLCCSNPMGLDNIVLTPAASTPEPASLLMAISGIATLGLSWRRVLDSGRKRVRKGSCD
jgi:hypothetical protein